MHHPRIRNAVTAALAAASLLTPLVASAAYDVVSTWSEKFTPLSDPTELAGNGVQTYGRGYDLDIPATFTFRYNGETITYLRPHGQGVIGFNRNEYVPYGNAALPYGGTPAGMIAPWWDQWARYADDPFEGGISWAVEGSGDHEILKVQWTQHPYYYCYVYRTGLYYTCDHMKHFTFQVWIHESDGVQDSLIQFRYQHPLDRGEDGSAFGLNYYETYYGYDFPPYDDLSGTVGVENRARTSAVYGLPCGNGCGQADWPTDQVIMFGQPSTAELLASLSVDSFGGDDRDTTISASTSIRNVGALAATGTTCSYWLSADATLDPQEDISFGAHAASFDVASGATLTLDEQLVQPRPAPGWYHVCVLADPEDQVAEAFEDNNAWCTPGTYIVGVDFSGSVRAPPIAGPGDEMRVDVALTNVGHEAADVVYRLVLSSDLAVGPDPVTGAADIEIHREEIHLEGLETFAEGLDVLVPADALGPHENEVPRHVLLQVDPEGTLLEADEGNNLLASEPVVLIKADLRVVSMDLELPDGCFFGRPARLTMTVANDGAARARGFENALVLSDNGVLTSYDQTVRLSPAYCEQDADCAGTLGEEAFCLPGANACTRACASAAECVDPGGDGEGLSCVDGLCQNLVPAHGSQSFSFAGGLPTTRPDGAPLVGGRWVLGAISDFHDAVNEGNEANNTRPWGPALSCQAPAADFVATKLELPPTAASGEVLTVRRTILNRGNRDGAVSWRYRLSSNDILSSNDLAIPFAPGSGGTLALDAGTEDEATDLLVLPSGVAAGVYHLGIVLDPELAVHELSEDNNDLLAATTVDVRESGLRVATSVLPPAVVRVTYLRQLVATGGAGAYAWTVTQPPLPAGLRLQTGGMLAGSPVEIGSHVFGVKVQSGGLSADALLYLEVLPVTGPLTVTTDRLPAAYLDVPYRVELAALGGMPPYTWSLIGRPPQGISLKNDTLTGAPEIADGTAAPRTFRVQVKDSRATVAERELSLPVLRSADLSIQTTRIQDGLVGQPYQQILRGAGGEPPYTFTIRGLERTGLTYSGNSDTTALVSGIPERTGPFDIEVEVEDHAGQRARQAFRFAVIGQLITVQTDRALPPARRGEPYPETRLVSGSPEARWQLHSGELPDGIELGEDGLLSGVVDHAASPRTYVFLTRVSDDSGGEGFGAFSILVPADELAPRYRTTRSGCSASAAGGTPAGLLPALAVLALAALRSRPRPGTAPCGCGRSCSRTRRSGWRSRGAPRGP